MLRVIGGLLSGMFFGAGLALSGMINPAKVTAFLDLAGDWDPSLAFVMLGAVATTALGYRLAFRRGRPFFDGQFSLPTRKDLDFELILGATIFGLGWGIGGYCPGPALAGLGFGARETVVFVAAMLVGMAAARGMARFIAPPANLSA
ncbi:MAG: YeeE/YedE family protein [Rhodospirillaceae bacterium]|nr:MAG: YeeE/YedE family protein [Rhodospirillaceae bacterium]